MNLSPSSNDLDIRYVQNVAFQGRKTFGIFGRIGVYIQ